MRTLPIAALAMTALLAACATPSPVVYPHAPAAKARPERVQGDIAACRARAEAAVGLNRSRATERSAQAGVVGFFAGAAASLAGSRDIANKAAAGAAAGATGVATKLLLERHLPDEVHREYVERCLREQGHDVLGWR